MSSTYLMQTFHNMICSD